MYRGQNAHRHANRVREIQAVAFTAVQAMLGVLLFVIGAALSLTLFLVPVGLLLALLGIVLLTYRAAGAGGFFKRKEPPDGGT